MGFCIESFENASIEKNNKVENRVLDEIEKLKFLKRVSTLRNLLLSKEAMKYKEQVINILKRYRFNPFDFYQDILVDIATLDNLDINFFNNTMLINNVSLSNNEIVLETEHGVFRGRLLAETLNDSFLLQEKSSKEIYAGCHRLTEYVLEKYKLEATTSFCKMNFGGLYLHSYNTGDDNFIYDASHNLIISMEEYQRLFSPIIINQIGYEDYINSSEYTDFVNGVTTTFPIYAIADKRMRNK